MMGPQKAQEPHSHPREPGEGSRVPCPPFLGQGWDLALERHLRYIGSEGMETGQLSDQEVKLGGRESSWEKVVPALGWTTAPCPALPSTPRLQLPAASCHHVATVPHGMALEGSVSGASLDGPPTVALGCHPSVPHPLGFCFFFFFLIYLFCYLGGEYQMNKITFKW